MSWSRARTPSPVARAAVRSVFAALLSAALVAAVAGCAGSSGSSSDTLTVYSGQHEDLTNALAKAFTKQTGIKLKIRTGDDPDLANQIKEEGDAGRADIFLTEEPGPLGMLDNNGLLSTVNSHALAEPDKRFIPGRHHWLPYAARARVMYYDPKLIAEKKLPDSILDLTKPEWKHKFAYAPSGAFVSTVSYMVNTMGRAKTLAWLKGVKANGVNEGKNGKVRDTVEAGQHPFGLSNHYYWWRLAQQKGGPSKMTSKIHYIDHPDPGSLVLASGAAVLKSSDHKAKGQRFLTWLASATGGQKIVGGPDAKADGAQYPITPGVKSKVGLPPLSELKPPKVDQGSFADTGAAKSLLLQAGIS